MSGYVQCLFCDKPYANCQSLVQHTVAEHHPSLNSMTAIYGVQCPMCGGEFANLGSHTRVHELGQLPQVFTALADEDPHGVVIGQRNALVRLLMEDLEESAQRMGIAATPPDKTFVAPLDHEDVAMLTHLSFEWDCTPQQALKRCLRTAMATGGAASPLS